MKRTILGLLVAAVLVLSGAIAVSAGEHIRARLAPVGGSGATGTVQVVGLPHGGARINVVARGLEPGESYFSLYYDNHTCALEPYSEDDVIGGEYTADDDGVGHTNGLADEDLDEINSVSVRYGETFELLACADIHP